ncbi:MAG: phosphotransferase, partial [Acidimicrobiales bacterium]
SGHPEDVVARALEDYLAAAELDAELAWAFCGVEVIRRLLGVAQLPLAAGLAEKASLLDRARERMRAVG